jgi:hypothetical protein
MAGTDALLTEIVNAYEDASLGFIPWATGRQRFDQLSKQTADWSDGQKELLDELQGQFHARAGLLAEAGTEADADVNSASEMGADDFARMWAAAVPRLIDLQDGEPAPEESPEAGPAGPAGLQATSGLLPVRHAPAKTHPHVAPLPDNHNGLVHGAVVTTAKFRVVCKAYRWFRHHTVMKGFYEFVSGTYDEEVGGVCEQFDLSGKLIQRWTVGTRFPAMYASTSVALPHAACLMSMGGPKPTTWTLEGFYMSDKTADMSGIRPADPNSLKKGFPIPDSGKLNSGFYKPNTPSQLFGRAPNHNFAVENALFTASSQASPRLYPVSTNYLKIYSPTPTMNEVSVRLVGGWRVANSDRKGVKQFDRYSRWHAKTFR